MVMQSTHRLYVTDEVRFVAALHALSEIELKLRFFSLNLPYPERNLLPCRSKKESQRLRALMDDSL